jgi:hypothetical protein
VVYDDGPQMPWTEIQPVGICRVRFEGADYLGTLRRGNTRGRVYRWSVTASAFVEAEHAGRGHKCHVRLSSSPNPPETGVATFQQFEYLDAPARTLTDYDPDAPLFARALPLGAQRRRPLYACRVERRYDRPKDTTLGKKTLRKDGRWVPDVQSHADLAVRRRHANNPKFSSLPWPDNAAARYPYVAIEKLPNYNYRPNAGLTIAFSRLAARRLARRISSHPDYPDVRIALAREALGCASPESLAPFVGTHGASFEGRGYDPWQQFQFNASSHTAGGALLYAVASSFGVKPGEWSLEFQPALEGDHALPIYVTASWSMPQFVQGVLLEPLLQELGLIQGDLPTSGRMASIFGEEFGCVDDVADRVDLREEDRQWLCDELEQRQGAVAHLAPAPVHGPAAPAAVAEAHCAGCHETLPSGSALAEAITPDARGVCRMPLGRACLSKTEREALLEGRLGRTLGP